MMKQESKENHMQTAHGKGRNTHTNMNNKSTILQFKHQNECVTIGKCYKHTRSPTVDRESSTSFPTYHSLRSLGGCIVLDQPEAYANT